MYFDLCWDKIRSWETIPSFTYAYFSFLRSKRNRRSLVYVSRNLLMTITSVLNEKNEKIVRVRGIFLIYGRFFNDHRHDCEQLKFNGKIKENHNRNMETRSESSQGKDKWEWWVSLFIIWSLVKRGVTIANTIKSNAYSFVQCTRSFAFRSHPRFAVSANIHKYLFVGARK